MKRLWSLTSTRAWPQLSLLDTQQITKLYKRMKSMPISQRLVAKRSHVHGWGLFVRVEVPKNEMIVECVLPSFLTPVRDQRANAPEAPTHKTRQRHTRVRTATDPQEETLFTLHALCGLHGCGRYMGETIRSIVADLREKQYEEQGVGSCYLFRLDRDEVCDRNPPRTRCAQRSVPASLSEHQSVPTWLLRLVPPPPFLPLEEAGSRRASVWFLVSRFFRGPGCVHGSSDCSASQRSTRSWMRPGKAARRASSITRVSLTRTPRPSPSTTERYSFVFARLSALPSPAWHFRRRWLADGRPQARECLDSFLFTEFSAEKNRVLRTTDAPSRGRGPKSLHPTSPCLFSFP